MGLMWKGVGGCGDIRRRTQLRKGQPNCVRQSVVTEQDSQGIKLGSPKGLATGHTSIVRRGPRGSLMSHSPRPRAVEAIMECEHQAPQRGILSDGLNAPSSRLMTRRTTENRTPSQATLGSRLSIVANLLGRLVVRSTLGRCLPRQSSLVG